jgi:hypothetical protein
MPQRGNILESKYYMQGYNEVGGSLQPTPETDGGILTI